MERKKPKMDEEMKTWFCTGKVRMRLKNEMRGRRRSTIGGDYKGLRPFWPPSNWSDDNNIPPGRGWTNMGGFWGLYLETYLPPASSQRMKIFGVKRRRHWSHWRFCLA
ncbi:hypothetical protein NC653_004692 [Populus alba x Populus x berolinensis]|uniref:Uncharacterized protein n=2 Tax=Populus alba x Populus x berolinensis TaxID=444605 RepID=A0AAD6WKE0_9ROSI|nr:hypothetical protein NC653_004692 [Populus alba x Populus x berolinensis]